MEKSSLDATMGVGGDPCSGRGSGGQSLPPSSVPYESSPRSPNRKRGSSYLKWLLVRNSASIIMEPNLSSIVEMAEEQPIMPKDLDVIREGYSIPDSIVLSAPALHETPRDYCPGHLFLNEHMLRAGVQRRFGPSMSRQPVLPSIPRRGCLADRYLWRELLIYRLLQGYVVFLTRDDVKTTDNLPDPAPGWESRFFFARLSLEKDNWGVPEKWGEIRTVSSSRGRDYMLYLRT
ncbi:hypothetical protein ACLOJK_009147 [Asimina triloba]